MNDTMNDNIIITGVISELESIRRIVHSNNGIILEHEVALCEEARTEKYEEAAETRDRIKRVRLDSLVNLAHAKKLSDEYYDVKSVINKVRTIPDSK